MAAHACHPLVDDRLVVTLEYFGYALCNPDYGPFSALKLFPNDFNQVRDAEGLDQYLVSLKKNRVRGGPHLWISAIDQRNCVRLHVAHGADHRQAVAGTRHMKVGQEDVKAIGSDITQRIIHS